jgi:hypothetical protein
MVDLETGSDFKNLFERVYDRSLNYVVITREENQSPTIILTRNKNTLFGDLGDFSKHHLGRLILDLSMEYVEVVAYIEGHPHKDTSQEKEKLEAMDNTEKLYLEIFKNLYNGHSTPSDISQE